MPKRQQAAALNGLQEQAGIATVIRASKCTGRYAAEHGRGLRVGSTAAAAQCCSIPPEAGVGGLNAGAVHEQLPACSCNTALCMRSSSAQNGLGALLVLHVPGRVKLLLTSGHLLSTLLLIAAANCFDSVAEASTSTVHAPVQQEQDAQGPSEVNSS